MTDEEWVAWQRRQRRRFWRGYVAFVGAIAVLIVWGIVHRSADRPSAPAQPAMTINPHPRCFPPGTTGVEFFVGCPDDRMNQGRDV